MACVECVCVGVVGGAVSVVLCGGVGRVAGGCVWACLWGCCAVGGFAGGGRCLRN